MFAQIWDHPAMRPLGMGIFYAALYVIVVQISWRLTRWLGRAPRSAAVDFLRWNGWATLSRVCTVTYTLIYLWAMLLGGIVAASDVGLGAIDWPIVWPWVLGLTAGAAAWTALLWGGQQHTNSLPERDDARTGQDSPLWVLARLTRQEAELAIWRAALAPALGLYWGVWLAVFVKWLMSRTNPALNAQLLATEQRSRLALGWALDWVAAAMFTFTGSLWLALGARLICYAVACLARSWSARWRAVTLANDQGQCDQCGEHRCS